MGMTQPELERKPHKRLSPMVGKLRLAVMGMGFFLVFAIFSWLLRSEQGIGVYWQYGVAFAAIGLTVSGAFVAINTDASKKVTLPKLALSLPNLSGDRNTFVGLDIGQSSIKMVQVNTDKDGVTILEYGIRPTPVDAIVNGTIKDRDALITAIKRLFQERMVRQKRIVTTLTAQNLIVRHAEFPRMSAEELREALKWEADQYIPIPKEDRVVDCQIISSSTDDLPTEKMKVMLVGAYQQPINELVQLLRAANLKPLAIDIEPLAVSRALGCSPTETGEVVVLLDIGAGASNLSIFADGILQMTRLIPSAGNDFTAAIADGLQIDWDAAEERKKQGGLLDGEIYPCLIAPVEKLAGELRRSLEFFLFKNRGLTLMRVSLVGGGALLKGLQQLLEQELAGVVDKLGGGLAVRFEIGHPAQAMAINPAIAAEIRLLDTILAPALGLALWEVAP